LVKKNSFLSHPFSSPSPFIRTSRIINSSSFILFCNSCISISTFILSHYFHYINNILSYDHPRYQLLAYNNNKLRDLQMKIRVFSMLYLIEQILLWKQGILHLFSIALKFDVDEKNPIEIDGTNQNLFAHL